jgi:low affinity Fe/Cu permease
MTRSQRRPLKATTKLSVERVAVTTTVTTNPPRVPLARFFHSIATKSAELIGSYWAFIAAVLVLIVWAITGPAAGFSDTWQLIINTGTSSTTFLMVFLIQHTQHRATKAVHLKLDELIRALEGARNSLVNLESMSDEDIQRLQKEFELLQRQTRRNKPSE